MRVWSGVISSRWPWLSGQQVQIAGRRRRGLHGGRHCLLIGAARGRWCGWRNAAACGRRAPLDPGAGLPVNAEHDAQAEQRIAQQASASARSRIGSARPDSVVRISRPSWSW
jgi:hypothetical protein